jgi:hypothetical protein
MGTENIMKSDYKCCEPIYNFIGKKVTATQKSKPII